MLSAGSIRQLAWFAAACYLAGWFLPAASEVPGWMAFRYALAPLWPYGNGSSAQGAEQIVPQVASALTNVAFVVMFLMILADKVRRAGLFFRVGIFCFIANLYWFVQMLRDGTVRDLWIGYYVWLAAFALLTLIGWMLTRRRSAPL